MRTIYKYKLPYDRTYITVSTHEGAKILHVDIQDGTPYFWVEVDTSADPVDIQIYAIGTGMEIPMVVQYGEYIGTVLLLGSKMVMHYYFTLCRNINEAKP